VQRNGERQRDRDEQPAREPYAFLPLRRKRSRETDGGDEAGSYREVEGQQSSPSLSPAAAVVHSADRRKRLEIQTFGQEGRVLGGVTAARRAEVATKVERYPTVRVGSRARRRSTMTA